MKKFLAVALVAVMALSLVACGAKVDKTAVTEAYTAAQTEINAVNNLINENSSIVDQESIDFMNSLVATMTDYKTQIESEDLTQEDADAIAADIQASMDGLTQIRANVEAFIAAGGTEAVTEEQYAELNQVVTDLTEYANAFIEVYDSLDDASKTFVDDLGVTITDLSGALEAPENYTATQISEAVAAGQELVGTCETAWSQIEAQLAQG